MRIVQKNFFKRGEFTHTHEAFIMSEGLHDNDIAAILQMAEMYRDDPALATFNEATRRGIGQEEEPVVEEEEEGDDLPDLDDLDAAEPAAKKKKKTSSGASDEEPAMAAIAICTDEGFVVIRPDPTKLPSAYTDAIEAIAKRPNELAMCTNLETIFKEVPDLKEKQEEGDMPPPFVHKTHVTHCGDVSGLVLDATAFPYLKGACHNKRLEPGIGYYYDTIKTGDEEPLIFIPSNQATTPVGVVAATRTRLRTIMVPFMRGEDDPALPGGITDQNIVVMDRIIYDKHRPLCRVPETRDDREFRLTPELDAALKERSDDFLVELILEPGDILVTHRSHPIQLTSVDGKTPARVRVVGAGCDQKTVPGEKTDIKARPEKTVHAILTGACRKGAFGLEYPLEPGSCAPEDNAPLEPIIIGGGEQEEGEEEQPAASSEDQEGAQPMDVEKPQTEGAIIVDPFNVVGVDPVLRLCPANPPPGLSSADAIATTRPLYYFAMPMANLAGLDLMVDAPPPKKADQIKTYIETIELGIALNECIIENVKIGFICEGAKPVTSNKIKLVERAFRAATKKAHNWYKVNNKALRDKVSGLRDTHLPKAREVAESRREYLSDLVKHEGELRGAIEKMLTLGDAITSHVEKQRRTVEDKLKALRDPTKGITGHKMTQLQTSLAQLVKLVDGAAAKVAKRDEKAAAALGEAGTLMATAVVPDPDDYVPKPVYVSDRETLMAEAEKIRMGRKQLLAQIKASKEGEGDPIPEVDRLLKLVKEGLAAEYHKLAAAGQKEGGQWDRAPTDFMWKRINLWPHNPLEVDARKKAADAAARAKRKKERSAVQCEGVVFGQRCGCETFLSPAGQKKINAPMRCLKCYSYEIFKSLRARFLKVTWAIENGQITDVHQEKSGAYYFWYAAETGVRNLDPETDDMPQTWMEEAAEFRQRQEEADRTQDAAVIEATAEENRVEQERRQRKRLHMYLEIIKGQFDQVTIFLDNVHENPVNSHRHAGVHFTKDFKPATTKLATRLADVNVNYVPNDIVDDEDLAEDEDFNLADMEYEEEEEEDEYDTRSSRRSSGEDAVCEDRDCGGLVMGDRCVDCGLEQGAVAAPRKARARVGEVPAQVQADAQEGLGGLRPRTFGVRQLWDQLIKELPEGPVKTSQEQLRTAFFARDLEGMATVFRVYITTKQIAAPSGELAYDQTVGVPVTEDIFPSREAAETYMRQRFQWTPEHTHMYAAPVPNPRLTGNQ